jgi:hypothetical protein
MTRSSKTVRAGLYAAFALAGVATTMLGPLMPALQARWNIADSRGGLLFTAQFLASVCSAALVGVLTQRFGYGHPIRFGLLLLAAGVAGCAVCPWPLALACVALYGCGLGLIIPAGNLGIAALHPGAGTRPVMALNLCWCVGANSCAAPDRFRVRHFPMAPSAPRSGLSGMQWRGPMAGPGPRRENPRTTRPFAPPAHRRISLPLRGRGKRHWRLGSDADTPPPECAIALGNPAIGILGWNVDWEDGHAPAFGYSQAARNDRRRFALGLRRSRISDRRRFPRERRSRRA